MATVSLPTEARMPRSKLKIFGYGMLILVTLAGLLFAYNFSSIKGKAQLGADYSAHIVCSCRYIAGRDLKSCLTDLEPGMEMVSVTDDPVHKRITARVPSLAYGVAERRGKFGCIPLNAKEVEAID